MIRRGVFMINFPLSNNEKNAIITVIVSLLIFEIGFYITIKTTLNLDLGPIILIIISLIIILLLIILFYSNIKETSKLSLNSKLALICVIILCFSFISLGVFEFTAEHVKITSPNDGEGVTRDISISGTYKNVNNNTLIWLYTKSDKYYLEYRYTTKLGDNSGDWTFKHSIIGSENPEENGEFFFIGILLIDISKEKETKAFAEKYVNGSDKLPDWARKVPGSEIKVFRKA